MTKFIAELIWFAGVAGWYVIRQPFERRAKKMGVAKSFVDWREWALLACATLGLFVIPATYVVTGFPAALDYPFNPALAWLGVPVLGAALWLFRRSHADLGKNWSVSLKLRDQHALIKSGVYRLVRHPMYSSFFLLGIGQMLLLPNWLAGTSGVIGAGMLFAFRVLREERMMLESFGDEYRSYMAGTKRIIPWIL
jgi:protein-S-isoprenylcysteine O-methyltransferase Ste14